MLTGRIAAEPQVAGPGDRHDRRQRDQILFPAGFLLREQIGVQLILIEPGQRQIEIAVQFLDALEFRPDQIQIPRRLIVGPIVHQPVRLHLAGREIERDVNGNLGHRHRLGGQQPNVANDDHAVGIDHDRLPPPEGSN